MHQEDARGGRMRRCNSARVCVWTSYHAGHVEQRLELDLALEAEVSRRRGIIVRLTPREKQREARTRRWRKGERKSEHLSPDRPTTLLCVCFCEKKNACEMKKL